MDADKILTTIAFATIMIVYAISGVLAVVLYFKTPDKRWRRMKFWYAIASFVNVIVPILYFSGVNLMPLRHIGAVIAGTTILGSLITSYARLVIDKSEIEFQNTREAIFVNDLANGVKSRFQLRLVDPNLIPTKGKT